MDRDTIKDLLEAALERPENERGEFIAAAAGGDVVFRNELESLVEASQKADRFFEELGEEVLPTPIRELGHSNGTSDEQDAPSTDALIGQCVGNYEILGRLGGGGMGVVYKARHTKLDRFAALKFLPPHLTADSTANERFVQEARAAYALEHRNICTIYDVGETDDGRPFIAMAYYTGQALNQVIREGKLSTNKTLGYVSQITEGLQKAHERGIVHRDIKPANIFVTEENVIKILDFGIAKAADKTEITKSGSTLGTIAYMSPEQARGEQIDITTDIWSLGVVWYEMLCGRRPFEAEYPQATIYNILNVDPDELPDESLGDYPWMTAMIKKCLAKDSKDRYGSAADLYAELYRNRRASSSAIKTPATPSGPVDRPSSGSGAQLSDTQPVDTKKKKIFISYRRDAEPDHSVAEALFQHFSAEHDVFIDTRMLVGAQWAEQIETEITTSNFMIILLSSASVSSEMIQAEVELASSLRVANQSHPVLLPVRLDYTSAFNYPLSAHLNHLNWVYWSADSDTDGLIEKIEAAILNDGLAGSDQLPELGAGNDPTGPIARPLTAAQPALMESPEGTMNPQSDSYVVRDEDGVASAAIGREGVTLTIKGPRQMGKSSLLIRTITQAREAGKEVVFLDFQLFDSQALEDADVFFRQFCSWISDELDLEDDTEKYWKRPLGNSQRATRYMSRHILKHLDQSLVLAMDEVERVFESDFRSDFFSMLRSWHNDRAIDPKWRKLDLALVTSTEPYQLIENLNQSPFNVGEIISLQDFTEEQVKGLNQQQGHILTEPELKELYAEVGGHPYLTRKALYLVGSNRMSFGELMANIATDESPLGDHLRYHFFRLHRHPQLVEAMKKTLETGRLDDDKLYWRLHGAGLVKREGSRVLPRCRLYRDYMEDTLNA